MKELYIINSWEDLKLIGPELNLTLEETGSYVPGKPVAFSGNGNTGIDVVLSEEIQSIISTPYSAGVAQSTTVALSAVTDSPMYIKLIVTTIGTMNVPMRTFEAATAAEIATLINAYGAQEGLGKGITASEAGGTVTIAGVAMADGTMQTFRVAASELAVITYGTSSKPATGPAEHVSVIEESVLPFRGVTNKVGFPVVKPASDVVSGNTYDIVTFAVYPVANSKDGMNAIKVERVKIICAIKVGIKLSDTTTPVLGVVAGLKVAGA